MSIKTRLAILPKLMSGRISVVMIKQRFSLLL